MVFRLLESGILTIGHEPVGIVGIVVVQTPVRVHVARIVGVIRVGSTEPLTKPASMAGLIAVTLFVLFSVSACLISSRPAVCFPC